MGLAIWSTLEKGLGQTTLEFKISLFRPITPGLGLITAEGTVSIQACVSEFRGAAYGKSRPFARAWTTTSWFSRNYAGFRPEI